MSESGLRVYWLSFEIETKYQPNGLRETKSRLKGTLPAKKWNESTRKRGKRWKYDVHNRTEPSTVFSISCSYLSLSLPKYEKEITNLD